jgi:photosystem II stability/assembly factor-like uncharacterized protein
VKADISRSTFRRTRHYSGVVLQQGRVQLDADFNEQGDIGRHRDRLTTRDVVGPTGAPATGGGFSLTAAVLLEAIGFANQDGVAVGERGTRLTTSDGGANWAAANSGTKVDLHAVSVVDANNVWAVGSGATIRKGTVAGAWSAQSTPSSVKSDLRGVHFRDANNGVAVGAGPVVLATTDGGANWATQNVPAGVTENLNAVHFPTAGTGFAVGDAGRILTFSSGSWKTQSGPVGFAANLRAVRFASAQKGWAVGDGGSILATTDGGTNWVEQDAPLGVTGALRAIELDPANADIAWAAGDDGTLIRTLNSGAEWKRIDAPASVTADLCALAARPASTVAVAGDLTTLAEVASGESWAVRTAPATARDLAISAGRYYVDGILCEIDRALRYADQPDYPAAPDGAQGRNLIYLDVWERHVTALEDPSLREVALGGPDTATRTKTVWQVRIADQADIPAGGTCDSFTPNWIPPSQRSTGRLRARAEAAQIQTNECMVPLGGGYRRLENQLYRVEIHGGGTSGAATYKWSRDNGSVVARLEAIDPKSQSDFSSGELTVSEPGHDAIIGFAEAAFVELSDEGRVLRGEPGILLEVDTITGNTIKWKGYGGNDTFPLAGFGALPTVRRWEGTGKVAKGKWERLEAGVFVEFDDGNFRSGDYWTIPARTRTGTIEWTTDEGTPVFQPRHGTEHRYAPLGFAQLATDGTWTIEADCRDTFDPLTELATLVYIGGAGQEAMPGDPLPQRLEVGVFRGRRPIKDAHIRFAMTDNGQLGAAANALGAPGGDFLTVTDPSGIAGCFWQLEANTAKPSQVVTAELRDDLGNALGPVVHFNGSLSIAQQVAYVPDAACADLQNAKTVQAAIDVLCKRPTGGGGCAVTVGIDDPLDEVVKKLIEEGRTNLCLCLLPGDHKLPNGLGLENPDVDLELTGCGRGTRLLAMGDIRLDSLDSVILRDLDVVLQTDAPLLLTDCDEVEIKSCHITGQVPNACQIGGADHIRLSSNVLSARTDRGPLQLLPEISQIVRLLSRAVAARASIKLAQTLVDPNRRAAFTNKLQSQAPKLEALTPDERAAYKVLFALLAPPRPYVVKEATAAFLGIYDAAARAAAGVALAILDAEADTTLTDNELSGVLCLYGETSTAILNVDQMKLVADAQRQGRIALSNSRRALHLRDNRITRVTYAEEMLQQLLNAATTGGIAQLAPAYRSIFASSNLVENPGNQLLATRVGLDANDFDTTGFATASTVAASATFVGNSCAGELQIFVAAISVTEAANLQIEIAKM